MLGTCPNTTSIGVMDSSEEGFKRTNIPHLKHVQISQKNGRMDDDSEKRPFCENCGVGRLYAH